jgi:hypothetical protein
VAARAAVAADVVASIPTKITKVEDTQMIKALTMAVALACAALPHSTVSAQAPAKPKSQAASAQRTFDSPEAAAKALADAVRAQDANAVLAVVGPSSKSWISSGDPVADREAWKKFLAGYDKKNSIAKDGDTKAMLAVGDDDWPFPAPLVNKAGKWAFDAEAGREEVINRRVGRNELDTIQTMLAVVDAQRIYASKDPDGNGVPDYAASFMSAPGKKDGLYWDTKEGEPQSPLGPLVGAASAQGYAKQAQGSKPQAYHGYYYRIITRQGKDAAGGAYDYKVKGKLFGGFAVVAYPASYGVSGVQTFIVNHEGVVYEKDLGASTSSAAAAMSAYNPDKTWKKAE